VRRIYHVSGRRIKSLDELTDLECYVATNGENFKNITYPQESDLQPKFNGYSKENLNEWKDPKALKQRLSHRNRTNNSTGGLLMEESKSLKKEPSIFLPTVNMN
jgi:hypothetical protein